MSDSTKKIKYKSGDKVRVIGNSNHHQRLIGDVCYLVDRSAWNIISWATSSTLNGDADDRCYIREIDMELMTSESSPLPTGFKVGDEVKIRKDSYWYGEDSRRNPADTVGIIRLIVDPNEEGYSVEVDWPSGWNNYKITDLEYADKEIVLEPEPEIPSRWANVEIGYY